MGALGSAEDLEKIIEAANAFLSVDGISEKPGKTIEAAEVPIPTDGSSTKEPEIAESDLESDPHPRPDPDLESSSTPSPALNSKVPYFFFLATFIIWLVSLLTIYIPIAGWVTPIFPTTVNNTILMIFLVSAGLASVSSLLIGLHKLGK